MVVAFPSRNAAEKTIQIKKHAQNTSILRMRINNLEHRGSFGSFATILMGGSHMTQSDQLLEALEGQARRREGRRAFFRAAVGAAAIGAGSFLVANRAAAQTLTDADVLNFALNLEYLEANFYSYAVFGTPIAATSVGGTGTPGAATGGRAVRFSDPIVAQHAREIALDEIAHVNFLRQQLGAAAVAQPAIDVGTAASGGFSSAARAAGVITGADATFDPYASDENFLLGAFLFEDVGVTAYKGSVGLLTNKTYIDAAAGIHAAEAYHAAMIRTTLDQKGIATPTLIANTEAISNARDRLDGSADIDQGIARVSSPAGDVANIAPTDANGIAFGRTAQQVLNIVYLNAAAVTAGGFFPAGVNGTIRSSALSA